MDEKYTDDVQKLLDMGKEKAFLTYDDINQELPEGLVSPDDIEDIFATLSGEGITISDSEEKFLETAAAVATAEKKFEEPQEEELELDLTPGALDKTNDPVRLYLREMGVVPLLTREGEVAIAKRIERGKIRMQKAISRSPVAITELLRAADLSPAGTDRASRLAEAAYLGAIVTGDLRDVPALMDAVRRADPQYGGSLAGAVETPDVLRLFTSEPQRGRQLLVVT